GPRTCGYSHDLGIHAGLPVHPAAFAASLRSRSTLEDPVADQCVGVEAGRVRRSLTRALLVLGDAAIATVLGWLLSSASASAAELPILPVAPSTLVSSVVPAILPATSVLPATPALPTPKLPSAPPDLGQVAQQVHLAVAGDDRVVPSVPPVAVL